MRKRLEAFFLFYIGILVAVQATEFVAPELPKTVQVLLEQAQKVQKGDLNKALIQYKEALIIAKKKNEPYTLYAVEHGIALAYEDNNALDSAEIHYLKALSYTKNPNFEHYQCQIYNDLAIVKKLKGDFLASESYYNQSLELGKKTNDLESQEFAFHGLGTLQETQGKFEKAVEYYWESVRMAEKRGNKEGIVNTIQNLATTYTRLKNHTAALSTIEKAYSLAKEEKSTLLMASVLFDYGRVLNGAEDYNGALQKYSLALDSFRVANFKPLIARTLFYMADTYTAKGNLMAAKAHFESCKQYEQYISVKSRAELNTKLGRLYSQENDWTKAKDAFLSSYTIAHEHSMRDLEKESANNLANTYSQLGDYKNAYQYGNFAKVLQDSLISTTLNKNIAELQISYDTEKREKEIQSLRLKQFQTILLFGGVLLIGFISILLYILRLRTKNNAALQVQNQHIETQNRLLFEKNAALEQFAFAAAHDLKEPLRNIGSFSNLLQRQYKNKLDDNANEYLSFIVNGAKRMNDLLVALLNFSELTADQATITRKVNLNEAISTVEKSLKYTIHETNASINYHTALPLILMKEEHLLRLLQNLVSNAIKFVDKKAPFIFIDAHETDKQIVLSVKDNGIGIEKEYEDKIYRLFQQLHKNSTFEGSGVGLSICKNIVDKYGGKIWYESELHQGTTFFVELPKK
jgi:signal transduction histidine kinase